MLMNSSSLTKPLTFVSSAALYDLGQLYHDNSTGRIYRYVKAAAACATDVITLLHAVCWDEGGEWIVNNDVAGGTGLGVVAPAGVIIAPLPELYFGWIQVAGLALCIGDGSIAKADAVVLDAGNDGQIDTMADGEEEQVFGTAIEADAPNVNIILKTLV
ncbi:hypothetical protein CMI37_05250 [Candidatus Pacearchaeota archaeon]|nr:hypothetical protein [Candidatus Pacearchaeota archaeon]|tara:strand:- start:3976 stop:4452 length:477 start_codon:yes stop_codon:yes gene_type:complete